MAAVPKLPGKHSQSLLGWGMAKITLLLQLNGATKCLSVFVGWGAPWPPLQGSQGIHKLKKEKLLQPTSVSRSQSGSGSQSFFKVCGHMGKPAEESVGLPDPQGRLGQPVLIPQPHYVRSSDVILAIMLLLYLISASVGEMHGASQAGMS